MQLKKVIVFLVGLLFTTLNGLAAQATSSSNFYVNQQGSFAFTESYSTVFQFANAINVLVNEQRQAMTRMGLDARITWVQDPTRMESELVERAYKEIPNKTRIGSAYLIQFLSYNGTMIYNIYIYTDSDGEKYYKMLRIQL